MISNKDKFDLKKNIISSAIIISKIMELTSVELKKVILLLKNLIYNVPALNTFHQI